MGGVDVDGRKIYAGEAERARRVALASASPIGNAQSSASVAEKKTVPRRHFLVRKSLRIVYGSVTWRSTTRTCWEAGRVEKEHGARAILFQQKDRSPVSFSDLVVKCARAKSVSPATGEQSTRERNRILFGYAATPRASTTSGSLSQRHRERAENTPHSRARRPATGSLRQPEVPRNTTSGRPRHYPEVSDFPQGHDRHTSACRPPTEVAGQARRKRLATRLGRRTLHRGNSFHRKLKEM